MFNAPARPRESVKLIFISFSARQLSLSVQCNSIFKPLRPDARSTLLFPHTRLKMSSLKCKFLSKSIIKPINSHRELIFSYFFRYFDAHATCKGDQYPLSVASITACVYLCLALIALFFTCHGFVRGTVDAFHIAQPKKTRIKEILKSRKFLMA